MSDDKVYAVIMAGGSGTRFWPWSRTAMPKQLLPVAGDATMIQATVARLQPLVPPERVLISTTEALAEATRAQLPQVAPECIIAEPVGRDTAPCVALSAMVVERMDPDATMILLPADQVISPADAFQATLRRGVAAAADGSLVTYGIAPRFAATGYGYVKLAGELETVDGIAVNRVERFVEKPDQTTAEGYLAEGCYRWNSGIFTWRVDTVLEALRAHCPTLMDGLAPAQAAWGSASFAATLGQVFPKLEKISIDYALLEKATGIKAVTATFAWDDLGSWDALYGNRQADAAGVIAEGDVIHAACRDSLFTNLGGQALAAYGCQGLTVVVTDDAVLVVPKGESQGVKEIVNRLKVEGRSDLL